MKRIGIDIRHLCESHRTGIPSYTFELTRALIARRDHNYALFFNAFHGRVPADMPAASTHAEYRASHIPNRFLNLGFRTGTIKVERFTGALDAMWLSNICMISAEAPLVATAYDLSFLRYPHFFTFRQRLWHKYVGTASLLRRATRIAAISEYTKADVCERYDIDPARVVVAPPGVHPRFTAQDDASKSAVRNKYGLTRPFILYLGTLEPRKNVPGLIAAFDAASNDHDLVLAGVRGWKFQEILDRAARSPKRDRIKFLGYVREEDKPALYSAADLFVYPSFFEGFGMPPAEAMACGTPVVTGRDSSLGEVVGDAGLMVDPYDTGELSRVIDAVLEDEALRLRLRTAGPERSKRFTWERSAEIMAELFEEM